MTALRHAPARTTGRHAVVGPCVPPRDVPACRTVPRITAAHH
ncbi:hypothetical protein [Aquabacterium olei]|nr:hypothetical protein [Aquabacterium olei]